MNWAALIWFIILVVFLLAEARTVTLISSWFAVGAVVAMIASFFGAPFWLQGVLFLAVSISLLLALRPLLRKYIKPKIVKTNVDSVIGSTGKVTVCIDNDQATGQVKLGAMDWTARSTSGEVLEEGMLIRVDRIEGVKVFVSPAKVKETV